MSEKPNYPNPTTAEEINKNVIATIYKVHDIENLIEDKFFEQKCEFENLNENLKNYYFIGLKDALVALSVLIGILIIVLSVITARFELLSYVSSSTQLPNCTEL